MKYWAYVKNEILGPFEKEKLLELPEFSPSLLICPQTPVGEKTEDWKEASSYPEVAAMLGGQSPAPSPAPSALPPASSIGEPSQLNPSPLPAAEPAGGISPAPAEQQPPAAGAAPGAGAEAIQLEPRSGAPASGGGLKHLSPTEMTPTALPHKEPGGSFDIPVVKLSGELSGHGKIGHPGTIQSDELHKSENAPPAAAPAESPAAEAPPAAAPQEPAQAAEPAPQPAADIPAQAAPAIEPAPQAAAEAAPQAQPEARNFSSSFDPISLSRLSGAKPPEAAAQPEPQAQPQPEPAAPAPQPAPAPAQEQAPAAPPFDPAVIEEIIKRNLKLAASPPPDIRPHLDPLVIKIDQMGEILSSMRNSQFQQEVLTKIRLIEDSVSELRRLIGEKQGPPAEKAPDKGKTSGFFGFGGAPAKKEAPPPEKTPEPEPAKQEEIVDEGSKGSSSKAGGAIKSVMRGILTLVLLAAVLGGAAFMLRNLGIFDVTPYIPFEIPGLTPATAPAAEQPAAEGQDGAAPAAGEEGQGSPEAADAAGDVSPEIVFIVRTYSAKDGGEILESKIFADAIKKEGDINKIEWKVSPPDGDNYKTEAVIPVKSGKDPLVYAFTVERGNKRVTPNNYEGREVLQQLFGQKPEAPKPAAKKPARKSSRTSARRTPKASAAKTARKTAPKAAPKPAAKPAPAAAEEEYDDAEYEYVYVEEEEAGGGDEAEYLMPGFGGR